MAQNQANPFLLDYANRTRGKQSLSLLVPCSDITFFISLRSDHGLTGPCPFRLLDENVRLIRTGLPSTRPFACLSFCLSTMHMYVLPHCCQGWKNDPAPYEVLTPYTENWILCKITRMGRAGRLIHGEAPVAPLTDQGSQRHVIAPNDVVQRRRVSDCLFINWPWFWWRGLCSYSALGCQKTARRILPASLASSIKHQCLECRCPCGFPRSRCNHGGDQSPGVLAMYPRIIVQLGTKNQGTPGTQR